MGRAWAGRGPRRAGCRLVFFIYNLAYLGYILYIYIYIYIYTFGYYLIYFFVSLLEYVFWLFSKIKNYHSKHYLLDLVEQATYHKPKYMKTGRSFRFIWDIALKHLHTKSPLKHLHIKRLLKHHNCV